LFASTDTNPHGCKIALLTKSANVHYLEGLPTTNVVVTFSLNPEPIADLREGKFPDGLRVTPSIEERLRACRRAQEMSFEVRWRVDPILPVEGWQDIYGEFFRSAAHEGDQPTRITLGTYRETQRTLTTFARLWGLPPMEWRPQPLEKDGMHYHLGREQRTDIYKTMVVMIRDAWANERVPVVALCKELRTMKREVGLDHDMCNCG
jgi:spore photoproduct lyase